MSAERALYSILSTTGAVTQLVGDRIYPVQVDQGASLPAISYQQISGPRFYEVSHAMGWVESRYQVNVWAATYLDAVDLSTAVMTAVSGYSGTVASLDIDHIFVTDEGDLSNLFAENSELEIHGKRIDIQIVFRE